MNYISIIISIISTLIAIFWLHQIAYKFNLIDIPNQRKNHKEDARLIGGISMFVGVFIGILFSSLDGDVMLHFIFASFIITITGMLDDMYDISVKSRFFIQIIVGFIMAEVAGVSLVSLGDLVGSGDILLNDWSIPITIFAMIGVVNAVNFSDGIDGLSASLSLITFSSIAFLAFISNSIYILQLTLIFIAVLIPFLFANLGIYICKNKKIFMGDAGSMFIGLGIMWLLTTSSQSETISFNPVTALWVFAMPLIDTMSIILRRILNGKSPFKPDSGHLHHFLQSIGYSDKVTLMIIVSLSFIMASIGIWAELSAVLEWKMFVAFIVVFLGYFLGTMYAWKRVLILKKK